MARCSACNRITIGGYKAGADRFCSLPCFTASPLNGFCADCAKATTDESPGGTFTFNTFGTRLSFVRDRCPECHSIVQTKAICGFFIPLIPLGRYRVIYVSGSRYVGRRLRRGASPVPARSGQASGGPTEIQPR